MGPPKRPQFVQEGMITLYERGFQALKTSYSVPESSSQKSIPKLDAVEGGKGETSLNVEIQQTRIISSGIMNGYAVGEAALRYMILHIQKTQSS